MGVGEPGGRRRDPEVALQGELEPPVDGGAVDRSDHGVGELGQWSDLGQAEASIGAHLPEVEPGAERLAGAGQDERQAVGVDYELLDRTVELVDKLARE